MRRKLWLGWRLGGLVELFGHHWELGRRPQQDLLADLDSRMAQPHEQHAHADHRRAPGGQDWGELGAHLELEAEVLSPYLDEAVSVLKALAASGPEPIRRIVDIGAGPGVAATALAEAFPDADVVAVDGAAALLTRASERAERLGVRHRITVMPRDLEGGLGALGPVDLAWVGMVLHHLARPADLLRELHGMLRPGGMLAVTEFGLPTRILPDDLGFGEPGFAGRHRDAVAAAIEAHLPPGAMQIDWPAMLQATGFQMVARRTIAVDLPAPLTAAVRRWVSQSLRRSAAVAHDRLSADDRATLAILTDPADPRGVLHRADVEVHAGRSFFVARKPRHRGRDATHPT